MIKVLKLIKSLLIGTIMLPLDIILAPIAIINLIAKFLYKRQKNMQGDIKTFIPVTKHLIKLKIEESRRK